MYVTAETIDPTLKVGSDPWLVAKIFLLRLNCLLLARRSLHEFIEERFVDMVSSIPLCDHLKM